MRAEERIKEERTNLATLKNLMGINGRIGVIVRFLGNQIMGEGSGMVTTNYMEDFSTLDEEEEIKTADEDDVSYAVGYVFDGLSKGMHIEIKYIDNRKELNVFYKGYEVYREVGGDLEKYIPRTDWEDKIDYLFGVAKKIEKTKRTNRESAIKNVTVARQNKYLEEIQSKWGGIE